MNNFTVIIIALFLTACTTTKTVEVPVPISCPKPTIPVAPHDYMADLNQQSTAPDFVRACLATRESYKIANDQCMSILRGYE